MTQYTTKEHLYEFVSELKRDLGIVDSAYPLNLIDFCYNKADVDLEYLDIKGKGLCGIAFIGDKIDTIILNSNRTHREQNYDCGHEMIHLSKHRNLGISNFQCYDKVKPQQNKFLEWHANEGAAELLVPYKHLLPLIKENQDSLSDWGDIWGLRDSLADLFHVTESVIKFRFESLRYEIDQYLNGCSLDSLRIISVNKQEQLGIRVKSLNDIADQYILEECCRQHDEYEEYVTEQEKELLDKFKLEH